MLANITSFKQHFFTRKIFFFSLFQETFKKEEQRRFEILAEHWDVLVSNVDLDK